MRELRLENKLKDVASFLIQAADLLEKRQQPQREINLANRMKDEAARIHASLEWKSNASCDS